MFNCLKCDVAMDRNTYICETCHRKHQHTDDALGHASNKETRIEYEQQLYPEYGDSND